MNYQNELYHHGIKGQKWGVRRFQNSDGSYTQEGKLRYSANPGKAYRDKYGELTEAGKKRDEERRKNFREMSSNSEGKVDNDAYYKAYEEEEKRIRSLFENSPNKKMNDPATQQKILKTWNDTLFSEYNGDYRYLSDRQRKNMVDELNKQGRKSTQAHNDLLRLYVKMRNGEITWNDYVKSKEWKNYEKAQKDYHDVERKYGGMMKMRTMGEIMKSVTPELRSEIYDMMSDFWYYD